MRSRESIRAGERRDRARQIAVRRGIAAEQRCDPWREPMEVQPVQSAEDRIRRRGQLEDHGAPTGTQHAAHLTQTARRDRRSCAPRIRRRRGRAMRRRTAALRPSPSIGVRRRSPSRAARRRRASSISGDTSMPTTRADWSEAASRPKARSPVPTPTSSATSRAPSRASAVARRRHPTSRPPERIRLRRVVARRHAIEHLRDPPVVVRARHFALHANVTPSAPSSSCTRIPTTNRSASPARR